MVDTGMHEAIEKGMFVKRDRQGGQMSRDMTLFKDDDGKAIISILRRTI